MICILYQILWGWRVKSRRMRQVVHVVCTERTEIYIGCWCRDLKERDCLDGLGIDGKMDHKVTVWDGVNLMNLAQNKQK
jgi:hypothetical protein